MEIVNVKKPEVFFGEYRIIIREFNYADYKSLIKLLNLLGLKRDLKSEKKMSNFALNGYKKLILKKGCNKSEYNKKVLEYKIELKKSDILSPIFESIQHSFQFTYSKKGDILAGSWRSELYNKDEFFSLILSNN